MGCSTEMARPGRSQAQQKVDRERDRDARRARKIARREARIMAKRSGDDYERHDPRQPAEEERS
jgi:hypothetical protein